MLGELHQYRRKEAVVRAKALLEEFNLADAADRRTSGYSGGMRRRLDLAATLVSDPEVLFLDEPTTGLDPRARAELWSVLDHLVDRGTTLLLTTQYLDEAERLADDIIVIDHGRIIARGDARKLKREVGGDHLQVVVVDPSRLDDAVRLVAEVTGARAPGRRRRPLRQRPHQPGRGRAGRGGQGPGCGGDRRRRPQPAATDPGRGVPGPHRGRPRRHRRGGSVVTATTVSDVSVVSPARPHERVLPEPRGVFHDTWVIANGASCT